MTIMEKNSVLRQDVIYEENLDKFTLIGTNRKVSMRHVNNLAEALIDHNFTRESPILVNANFEVLDGQHRLEACRLLELGVWYTVSTIELTPMELATRNTYQKSWTSTDVLTLRAKEGDDKARWLINMGNHWNVSPYALLRIATGGKSSKYDLLKGIRLSYAQQTLAETFMTQYFHHIHEPQRFLRTEMLCAVQEISKLPNFDWARMTLLSTKHQPEFIRVMSARTNAKLSVLLDMYNANLPRSKRLTYLVKL
jgi:hypothetical protein